MLVSEINRFVINISSTVITFLLGLGLLSFYVLLKSMMVIIGVKVLNQHCGK